MTELLTAAQMRATEQAAITAGQVTGEELMERAGQGVVRAVLDEWPELGEGARKAVVLCGPGNNGGDGFVVARLLKERGWSVDAYLYGDVEKMPPDARTNHDRWASAEPVHRVHSKTQVTRLGPDLVIDALFGTGLSRPVTGLFPLFLDLNEETVRAQKFGFANHRLTAIDLPTGICSDSGRILAPENWTDAASWWQPTHLLCQLTVSFHRAKCGHVLSDGPSACGKLVIADIGL